MLAEQGSVTAETYFPEKHQIRWASMELLNGYIPAQIDFGTEELDRGEDSLITVPTTPPIAERTYPHIAAAIIAINSQKKRGETLSNVGLTVQLGGLGKVVVDVLRAKQNGQKMSWKDYLASTALLTGGFALVVKGHSETDRAKTDFNLLDKLSRKFFSPNRNT